MLIGCQVVTLLILAITAGVQAAAIPDVPVTLRFAKRINDIGISNLLQLDQARARYLRGVYNNQPDELWNDLNVPVTNTAFTYVAAVSVSGMVV